MNKRVEMWALMREWLVYGAIDNNERLIDDLTGPEYSVVLKGQLKLESKESMKKRGLPSPNDGDALAHTFAAPVARLDSAVSRARNRMRGETADSDYDVFST